jgi:hypothetical protein
MRQRFPRLPITATFLFAAAAFSQTVSMPPASVPATAPAATWPTADGVVLLPNFRFGSGEMLPELRLHYLPLGTPHRSKELDAKKIPQNMISTVPFRLTSRYRP